MVNPFFFVFCPHELHSVFFLSVGERFIHHYMVLLEASLQIFLIILTSFGVRNFIAT